MTMTMTMTHPNEVSLPPPSFPPHKKEEGTFYYRNISGEEFNFCYSFKLIPKNRRGVKLQALQFLINSKTIGLKRVKTVIIFAAMVFSAKSLQWKRAPGSCSARLRTRCPWTSQSPYKQREEAA